MEENSVCSFRSQASGGTVFSTQGCQVCLGMVVSSRQTIREHGGSLVGDFHGPGTLVYLPLPRNQSHAPLKPQRKLENVVFVPRRKRGNGFLRAVADSTSKYF